MEDLTTGSITRHLLKTTGFMLVMMGASVSTVVTLACLFADEQMISFFSSDPGVIAVGSQYLRILGWGTIASGIIFVNGSMFQAMGNTIPPLIASLIRILIVAVPAILLSRMAGFELRSIWYLSVGATLLQVAMNLYLLRREFRARLVFDPVA